MKPDDSLDTPRPTSDRCQQFLEDAAAVAREQWTQFGDGSMVAGLVLFAIVLALQAAAAIQGGMSLTAPASSSSKAALNGSKAAGVVQTGRGWLQALREWQLVARVGRWRVPLPAFRAWLAAAALAHCLGIFSFFYLLSEGKCLLAGDRRCPCWAHLHMWRLPGRHAQVSAVQAG